MHFQFFLLDLVLWVGIGLYTGFLLASFERKFSKFQAMLRSVGLALCTGLAAALNNALPEAGIALDDTMFVLLAMGLFLLYRSARIRRKFFHFKPAKELQKTIHYTEFALKGGLPFPSQKGK